jgi:hypothetical protein
LSNADRAYGYARVCSAKATLLHRDALFAVRGTTDEHASLHAAEALGIATAEKRFARLLQRYRLVLRAYRSNGGIFRALLRLHEVENVKLAWRAHARSLSIETWWPLWRDFDDLATLPAQAVRNTSSLHDLAEAARRTPYADITRAVLAAHTDDLAAAEMAFDRWASAEAAREATQLPGSEALARELVYSMVRARDAQMVQRAETYGLSPAAVEAARVLRQPRRDHDVARLCRTAFRGETFHLAPAVALLIAAEEEYRSSTAVVERRGDAELDDTTDRLLPVG